MFASLGFGRGKYSSGSGFNVMNKQAPTTTQLAIIVSETTSERVLFEVEVVGKCLINLKLILIFEIVHLPPQTPSSLD